jgi:hypothetical protein
MHINHKRFNNIFNLFSKKRGYVRQGKNTYGNLF